MILKNELGTPNSYMISTLNNTGEKIVEYTDNNGDNYFLFPDQFTLENGKISINIPTLTIVKNEVLTSLLDRNKRHITKYSKSEKDLRIKSR